jgi:hypothetical protein
MFTYLYLVTLWQIGLGSAHFRSFASHPFSSHVVLAQPTRALRRATRETYANPFDLPMLPHHLLDARFGLRYRAPLPARAYRNA